MLPSPLGERLTQLRAYMAATETFTPSQWSRAAVAREAQLSDAELNRLENVGTGTATSLAALLHFYQGRGVNLAWILTPDNGDLLLHALQQEFPDEAIAEAVGPLRTLQKILQAVAAALAAGQTPHPQALHALVEQVQVGISRTIGYLDPPNPWQPGEADLAESKRLSPAVRAAVTGWYIPKAHAITSHHYAAGESTPRCGSRFDYLESGQGAASPSQGLRCFFCLSRLTNLDE